MPDLEFGCLPTVIGSMPHIDPKAACSQVARYLRDIPAWPQLPRRSFRENMSAQYSEGFPGIVLESAGQGDRLYIDASRDLTGATAAFYADFMENNLEPYRISRDMAAGLHAFLGLESLSPRAVKGQVTGPVTWGMTVTDAERRAIVYHEAFADVVPKFLRLKAAWQEKELRKISRNTIIFVDEPYMAAYGSVGVMLSREKIVTMLDEVFAGIGGLKGLHCCGNTDWSVLLGAGLDILSFDAYNYAASLSLYPAEIRQFLGRGGAIAWGIVPNDEASLLKETAASLEDRLGEAMAPFTRNGRRFKDLVARGLLTPSCGLAALSEEAAGRTLELLSGLSARVRQKYS